MQTGPENPDDVVVNVISNDEPAVADTEEKQKLKYDLVDDVLEEFGTAIEKRLSTMPSPVRHQSEYAALNTAEPHKCKRCCVKCCDHFSRVFYLCPPKTKQQRQPRLWSGDTYRPIVFSAIFLIGGIISMILWGCLNSLTVVELESVEYDKLSGCEITGANYTDPELYPGKCTFELTVTEDMDPPIYFYYELYNFWQNHREYRAAYSIDQLIGDSANSTSNCLDIKTYDGLNIYPCGNIAYSFFADRFVLSEQETGYEFCSTCDVPDTAMGESWDDVWANWSSEPDWSNDGIAWESDREYIFKGIGDYPDGIPGMSSWGWRQANVYGISIPDVTDEDLMVWMRVAALPYFTKPFRIIRDRSLTAGTTLNVTAYAFFDIDYPGSYKKVLLRTTNTPSSSAWGFAKSMGRKSNLLNTLYLITGIYLLFIGALALLLEVQTYGISFRLHG